jgi:hypothetical protein
MLSFDRRAYAPRVRQALRDGHDDKAIVDHLSIEPEIAKHIDHARATGQFSERADAGVTIPISAMSGLTILSASTATRSSVTAARGKSISVR